MKLAICVIAYNRLNSIKRCLEAISNALYGNDSVDLIVSIDYSGTDSIEKFANSFKWIYGDKRIIAHKENLGLRKHVLSCGEFTRDYDGLIVIEDDVFVAPSFFQYARECVAKYHDNPRIAGISLYSFGLNYHNWLPFIPEFSDSDIYLMQNAQSWGQVWMKEQWQEFMKWYEVNSSDFAEESYLPRSICTWRKSWLKYHTRYCIETNKYFIYPYKSLSTCFSDVGEHTGISNTLIQVPISMCRKSNYLLEPTVRYDAFFENQKIPLSLGIDESEISVDLYGEKSNREMKRYWLTMKKADYRIVDSFALELKPIENNIFFKIRGKEIFLYDTFFTEENTIEYKGNIINHFSYFYNVNLGVKQSVIIALQKIIAYIKRKTCC
jgi:hypothetical protein